MKPLPNEMYEDNFIEHMIVLMSKEYLEETAKIIKLTIPGFTARNISTLPEVLLRKHLKKSLQKIKTANAFLLSVIMAMEEEYRGLEKEEFLYKLENDKGMAPFTKLIILTYFFPGLYKNEENTIIECLKEKRSLTKALLGEKDVRKELEALASIAFNDLQENLPIVFPNKSIPLERNDKNSLVLPFLIFLKECAKDTFNDIDLDQLDQQNDVHICILFIQQLVEIWAKEKNQDAQEIKEQKSQIRHLREQNEKLSKQFEKLNKELKDAKTEHERIEHKARDKDQELKKIMNEKEVAELKYKKEIKQLRKHLEKLQTEKEKLVKIMESFPILTEHIKVFVPKKDEIMETLIGKERVCYFESIEQFSNQLKEVGNELIFIVTDGIPTKDIFKIEKLLKSGLKNQYRLVSQGTQKIIRSIISYLEGELHYEVVN